MVPTSSISKMFDIIRGENAISSYSTEELQEMLYISQHENLAHLSENNWHPLFHFFAGVIRPVVNSVDMEKIIRLEEKLMEELQDRGERVPERKYSRKPNKNNITNNI